MLDELEKNALEREKQSLKEKPQISKRSASIDKRNSKKKFLDRIKDEEIKYKQRRDKLIIKINEERAKKKIEIIVLLHLGQVLMVIKYL